VIADTARQDLAVRLVDAQGEPLAPIWIGTAIAETGLSVRYTATSGLVNELAEADANRRLSSVIACYSKIDLLWLDDFGYLNLDRKGAKLLFQIFTEREERKATAVATNSPFTKAHMFRRTRARYCRNRTGSMASRRLPSRLDVRAARS
jgi:DNA replication protein DnaC